MPEVREERSLGELFGQLSQDMSLLVRQEVQLARTELSAKISDATGNVVKIAAGGFVAYIGALALVTALILGLADAGIKPWLSALIVGIVLAGVGYFLLRRGQQQLTNMNITPTRTVETIKDDIQWAKEQRP